MSYTPATIFTQKDLEANKQGRLTAEQIHQIDKHIVTERSTAKYIGTFMVILFIGIFCTAYFSDDYVRYNINNFTFTGILWIAIAFCLPWILYFIGNKLYKIPAKKSYNIRNTQGIIQKISDNNEYGDYIRVNKINLYIEGNVYDMIKDNTVYILYYVEFTSWKMLLSWEEQ